MACCTTLLLYLLENNKTGLPEHAYVMILDIVKYNITKAKSKTLKLMNAQLEALLLWVSPKHCLAYTQRESLT